MKKLWNFLRTQWLLLTGAVFVLVVFSFTARFIEPPPPRHLVLAAGEKAGTYAYFAQRYAEVLSREKITVDVLETRGAGDNVARLKDPHSGVDVALVQGGTVGDLEPDSPLCALAAIYYEPLWIFYPKTKAVHQLRELKGRRLAIGMAGSGTRILSEQLLAWNGVTPANSAFMSISTTELAGALKRGDVDAVFYIGSAGNPVLKDLLHLSGVEVHSFDDAYAYVRKFGFLSSVLVPEGVLDMAQHLPERNVTLLAPVAMLVARQKMHPAIVYLLLSAAKEINGNHGLLQDAGMFPNGQVEELPLHEEAKRYFQSGPPLLQRFLPYHMAAFLDRTKILLLPIIALLMPLLKLAPPTYGWSIRRRIWRWYKALFQIETQLYAGRTDIEELSQRLHEIESKVFQQQVPLAYAAELYNLRQHIAMVRELLNKKESGGTIGAL